MCYSIRHITTALAREDEAERENRDQGIDEVDVAVWVGVGVWERSRYGNLPIGGATIIRIGNCIWIHQDEPILVGSISEIGLVELYLSLVTSAVKAEDQGQVLRVVKPCGEVFDVGSTRAVDIQCLVQQL